MSQEIQLAWYRHKLAFETDSADLFMALQGGENIIVVDGRNPTAYEREHIPGALNLPHRTLDAERVAALDKSALYICYCDGIGCNGSTNTALKLLTFGCRVKELIGGLDWWTRDGYATAGAEGREGTTVNCGC